MQHSRAAEEVSLNPASQHFPALRIVISIVVIIFIMMIITIIIIIIIIGFMVISNPVRSESGSTIAELQKKYAQIRKPKILHRHAFQL